MKQKLTSFLAGVLTAVVFTTCTATALAANGTLKLEANPIQVLVDGQVFQPKDAKGRDALVFTYNGTTYAPLRALAEAYGLKVGYDAASNTATVTGSKVKTDFASQWTITEKPVDRAGDERFFTAKYRFLNALITYGANRIGVFFKNLGEKKKVLDKKRELLYNLARCSG